MNVFDRWINQTMRISLWLSILAMSLAPVIWELSVAIGIQLMGWRFSEIGLLAIVKLGFAAVLALWLTLRNTWRRNGFRGGIQWRSWRLLWPLWLGAATSLAQLDGLDTAWHLPVWLLIAIAVSIGEEGVFRGLVMNALRATPRRAVIVSAALFGGVHLSGLLAPIDSRMIFAQAFAAGCLGLVLGATRCLTGSILPGLAAHAALDFCGLIAADGFAEAMSYSGANLGFVLGFGTVSLVWGIFLLTRLPREVSVAEPSLAQVSL